MPWFEVTAPQFDWVVPARKGRVVVSYPQGGPYFGTTGCVARGLEIGAVKRIKKPKGWKVDKAGKVVRDV